jgi:signal transduction histidine kinase
MLWKIQLRLGIVMAVILVLGLILSIRNYQSEDGYAYYNHARILVKDQLEMIQQSIVDGEFNEAVYEKKILVHNTVTYPMVITDSIGIVVYSDKEGYSKTSLTNLNEFLQVDQSLYENDKPNIKVSFVLQLKDVNAGYAGFFVPRSAAVGKEKSEVILDLFSPVILTISIVLFLYLLYLIHMKRRIVLPVQEMIDSSKAMMEGDYSVAVVKTKSSKLSSNEIDHLAYQFELMRDELKEKRRREEELNKSQKELISCISHDLKTPISTIKAYGEGLRDGMAKDPDKIQRYAEVIVAKAEVLTKMIRDLLEHSNAELHQLTITKKEQYFNDYINKVAKEFEGLVNHQEMNFTYVNSAPNLLISFDENRITQVIANLIDNSIKYSQNLGDMESCKKGKNGNIDLLVSYEETSKHLCITVRDNGNGIGAMDIPFVFDKFYRGEKSRTMSISGSGLGLSICKYIVDEHGGEIMCDSRQDKGTEFMIRLPV